MVRTVVNISLPQELTTVVDEAVESGFFASKSEFFRSLLRDWMGSRLVSDIEKSELEFAFGKGRRLRSLKDLS